MKDEHKGKEMQNVTIGDLKSYKNLQRTITAPILFCLLLYFMDRISTPDDIWHNLQFDTSALFQITTFFQLLNYIYLKKFIETTKRVEGSTL